jgi:hypothetical protein
MAINAYSVNVPIRESKNTYVPLPFEEMYATLQAKQQMYDQIDEYEREQKKAISALSSPISAHNEYLNSFKQRYLQDAMALHNSMPDKGSGAYKRKLQDMVDGYASDSNLNIINKSNAAWAERVKTVTKQMSDGKYSKAADMPYLSFTGMNPDGTLKPFVYAGNREKKDWQKMIKETIEKVPTQKFSRDITDKETGERRKISVESKSASAIANSLSTVLGMDPEALQDMQVELGITDPKDFQKHIMALAKDNAQYNSEQVLGYEGSLVKRADEKAEKEAMGGRDLLGTYGNPNYNAEEVSDLISEDGKVTSSRSLLSAGLSMLNPFDNTNPVQENRRLLNEKYGLDKVIQNYKGLGYSDAQAEKQALLSIRNRGSSMNLVGTRIADEKMRTNVENNIISAWNNYGVYNENSELLSREEKDELYQQLLQQKSFNMPFVSHKLAPNSMFPEGYNITFNNGKSYKIGMQNLDPIARQNHELYKAGANREPIKFENYLKEVNGRLVDAGPHTIYTDIDESGQFVITEVPEKK